MENAESLPLSPFVDRILKVFHENSPRVSVKYVSEGNVIVFRRKQAQDEPIDPEKDWKSIAPSINKLGEFSEDRDAPSGINFHSAKIDISQGQDLDNCYVLRNSRYENVLLLPETEYAKQPGRKIIRRDQKIEGLLRDYFRKHDLTKEEGAAAEALLGEAELVIPVVAGIKPVAVLHRISPHLEKLLAGKCPDIKVLPAENYNYYVLYNSRAVPKILEEHSDILQVPETGLQESATPKDVIDTLFIQRDPLDNRNPPAIHQAVGILLGFDRSSVKNFKSGKTARLNNIWDVNYQVADERHQDFRDTQARYDRLQATIEELLKEGFAPSEVIRVLPDRMQIVTMREASGKAVSAQLKI